MSRVTFAAGGVLASGLCALALILAGRNTPPSVEARPQETRSTPRVSLVPEISPVTDAHPVLTSASPAKRSDGDSASRTEAELVALEDQALRRVDVLPLLEAAGIDVAALRARPDAEDILRHVAGDEVLTRARMRDFFSTTVYPYGYPVDHALREARTAAESTVAQLSGQARVESLAADLEADSTELPEPELYPKESGRIYVDPSQPEAKPGEDEHAAP
jgi:hypothetical protein